jgi:DNA modification methylase
MPNVILYESFLSKVSDIATYSRNARQHSDEQIAQIVRSITEFGFTSPVLIDEAGVLIAGHGRLAAGRQLGMVEVPAIAIQGLDEAQKQALRLADNKLALNASWDDDLLRAELMDLRDVGFDLGLTGFGEQELVGLFADTNDGLTDPDDVPEPPAEPVTRLGDVWTLGRHRLVCGDVTLPGTVRAATDGRPIDSIVTDPPYSSGGRQDGGKRHSTSIGTRGAEIIARDNLTTKGYLALMSMMLANVAAETAYVFTDWRMWTWTYDALEAAGYPVRNMLVWDKEQMGMGFPWRAQHELVAFAKRTGAKMGDGKKGNVLKCQRTRNDLHPTQKPVALIEAILSNDPGANLFEPFAGSGTTLIAAETVGKNCFAVDVTPTYVDVAVLRWQAFTGQTATRQDGTSFPATSGAKTVHPDRGTAAANPDDDRLRYASGGNVRMPEDQQTDTGEAFPPRAGHRHGGGQHAGGPGALHQLHQEHERAGADLVDQGAHGLEGHQRTGRHANSSDDHNRGNP